MYFPLKIGIFHCYVSRVAIVFVFLVRFTPSLQRNVDVNLSQISIHSSKLTWPWKKPPFLYIFVVFIRGKNNFYGYVCLPEGKSHQKNGQNQQA